MTFALVCVFVVFFVGGPLIFRGLTRNPPTARRLRRLVLLTAGFVAVGLIIRFGLPDLWGQNLWVTTGGIVLIWFGWIGVLAFVALALRQNDPSVKMRRWTAIIGAMGTTVPWFGLASANMMQG